MLKRHIALLMAPAALLVLFGFGCGDGSSPASPTSLPAETARTAVPGSSETTSSFSTSTNRFVGPVRLRVAHLSTDAPPVDVWVNGALVLSDVPFKAVSDYLDLDAGEYRIQVTPAGAETPIVIDATVALQAGSVYTVAAVGFLSSNSLTPLVLLDDLSLGEGARLRFVHTSADTGAVDVAVAGGPVLFADVTFQKASEYVEVPGGTYDLEVRPAGSSSVALSIPGVEVLAGTTYTIFAVGRSFNGTLGPLPVVDAS
ncbi:MAG TPA: DUF4397 domain-containing protein [Vicinamibacteria bacterium]|nr:DUF4397 domain-containing protein [Vicinamibacteria bacterium]